MREFKIRFPRRLKVIVLAFLVAVTAIAFSACGIHCSEQQKTLNRIDSIAGNIGRSQITEDDNLIGERHCKDDYTGYYTARCDAESGRDVIFGGASIKERNLRVYGTVYTQSGTAKIRIRQTDEVKECEVDRELHFETELNLSSGGNYIMIDYDNFQGCVELHSDYIAN